MDIIFPQLYREYSLNRIGKNGSTITVAIPPEILKYHALKNGLTLDEFLTKFNAKAICGIYGNLTYEFIQKDNPCGGVMSVD